MFRSRGSLSVCVPQAPTCMHVYEKSCIHLKLCEGLAVIRSHSDLRGVYPFVFNSVFLERILPAFAKELATMDDCNNDNECLLQCFQQCIYKSKQEFIKS